MEIHLKIPLCLTVKADFSFVSKFHRGDFFMNFSREIPMEKRKNWLP